MWKHLVGLDRTSPGFATVRIAPKIDGIYGPKSVRGQFLSPSGLIKSSWRLTATVAGHAQGFTLNISLPIGVQSAEVSVPAPPADDFTPTEDIRSPGNSLVVSAREQRVVCNGKVVWSNGKFTAVDGVTTAWLAADGAGVVFGTTNGVFTFVSHN